MSALVKFTHACLSWAGIRVMQLKNCPRGTDPRLYADVLRKIGRDSCGAFVLDIGANVGDFSVDILKVFPFATIYAFEPSPLVFSKLEVKLSRHRQIHCYQAAMSEVSGALPFEVREDDSTLGRLITTPSEKSVLVPVETIDGTLARHTLSQVALLKSDTEGHELAVLKGAIKSLAAGKILSLLVECCFVEGSNRHVSLASLETFLSPLEYTLCGLYDLGYEQHTGQLRFCNALFKHKSVSSQP